MYMSVQSVIIVLMKRYNPKEIEPKWQKSWSDSKIYEARDDDPRPKKYVLEYFPYPSGAAMHVGHVRNYTIGDAMARHARMTGHNVLHPMGWDAFGLPAENYAIKNKISPRVAIDENTDKFRQQLTQMGFSYDWSREIDSSDPNYYRWTQWLFLLLFKKGLAYQQESLQWWCPHDKTVLANEQVEAGLCWRCGNKVVKKSLKQWFFKITDYADRLLNDLDDLDWSDAIKSMQRNWIGKSSGVEIDFAIDGHDETLKVFTTRADTLFGATFMVVAPEHPLLDKILSEDHRSDVENYRAAALAKSDVERQETNREKSGVFSGAYAINPLSKTKIPIWVADYVLAGYGTGAIMAVPAHDQRDFDFAKAFDLPIISVVQNDAAGEGASSAEGVLINSGEFDGQSSSLARETMVAALAKSGLGTEKVNYKMRDWLISRQRYWGAPIPIVHCPNHGAVAVPEDQLPVLLPEIESYEPSGDGRSPLANVNEFVHTTCPTCGGPAERETDTMDGFACSSWYFLRFADAHNSEAAFDVKKVQQWAPVDDYIGGAEHAVMHLLYARFWTKVMQDAGLINFGEPFTKLRNHGMILAPDGQKMSKSKGNTIQPSTLIDEGYGADTVRVMELFIGPWNQAVNWSIEGVGGAYRFLQRVWTLTQQYIDAQSSQPDAQDSTELEADIQRCVHQAIKKVSQDMATMSFNTALAALMECVNELYKIKEQDEFTNLATWEFAIESLLLLLAPFAPHLTEELWEQLGHEVSIHTAAWPTYDAQALIQSEMTIAVQVNGKLRGTITVPSHSNQSEVISAVNADDKLSSYLAGNKILKTIYVPQKLVNFVM